MYSESIFLADLLRCVEKAHGKPNCSENPPFYLVCRRASGKAIQDVPSFVSPMKPKMFHLAG
jgi:hypothetical protein